MLPSLAVEIQKSNLRLENWLLKAGYSWTTKAVLLYGALNVYITGFLPGLLLPRLAVVVRVLSCAGSLTPRPPPFSGGRG
jgi:hypothetical protein